MEEETGARAPNARREEEDDDEKEKEENLLKFLESLDSYITLYDSLSLTLRKGWLELASARHSMGSSRISSALFDHNVQSAATTLQVSESFKGSEAELQYTLVKWASPRDEEGFGDLQNSTSSQLRHRGPSQTSERSEDTCSEIASDNSTAVHNNIQRERSKSLAIFGTLVSPKLRSAQGTFETALETLIEIANMRSLMLSAFSRLQKEKMTSE